MHFFLLLCIVQLLNNSYYYHFLNNKSSIGGIVAALDSPLWVMQQKYQRYQRNAECMKRQKLEIDNYGLQPFRTVIVEENSTLWLRCFECLHPDDAEELEDIWKPSPSIIGRKIHKFLKMIKEKIARSRRRKKSQHRQAGQKRGMNGLLFMADYRWERLMMDSNNKEGRWVPATHGFEERGRNNQTAVMNFIDEVMSKGDATDDNKELNVLQRRKESKERKRKNKWKKTIFVGDHLELEMRKLDGHQHRGWYRCVKRLNKNKQTIAERERQSLNISQIFFVDVIQEQKVTVRRVSTNQLDWTGANETEFAANVSIPFGHALEVYGHASEWTPCNKCGNRTGEMRRIVSCYIRRKPIHIVPLEVFETNPQLQMFLALPVLPCASLLLPTEIRDILTKKFPMVYEEFAECKSDCIGRSQTRKVVLEEGSEAGNKSAQLLDVLPPGEYTTNERLPPLPPPIIRSTIFAVEGQRLQLDCSNQNGLALIWRKNFEELNVSRIFADSRAHWIWDDEQRVQLTAHGQLRIAWIRGDDAGLYSCTTFPGGHILRTFQVFYVAGDRTRHLLEWIPLILRSLLLLYVLLLLLDLISVKAPNM